MIIHSVIIIVKKENDLTKQIAFIGPAGCGKSTGDEELSATLKKA